MNRGRDASRRGRVRRHRHRIAGAGCGEATDDCERAHARLARIRLGKGEAQPSRATIESMIETCRTGKYARFDPVLRCAMDSASDAEAAACVERGIESVLEVGAPGDGSGLNPLLSQ